MKFPKRLLSFVLALAVLLVSLPASGLIYAAAPAEIEGLTANRVIYNYDFSQYAEGTIPDGFIFGGAKANPALNFGWAADSGTSVNTYVTNYSGKNALCIDSKNCDVLVLAPDVVDKNYVYEVTIVNTSDNNNAGPCVMSWGEKISDVHSALWFVGDPKGNLSYKGKRSGKWSAPNDTIEWEKSYALTSENGNTVTKNQASTFKVICYEGVYYYYLDGSYCGSATNVSNSVNAQATGGRVGVYVYSSGAKMYVTSMKVMGFGAAEELNVWNGSFDGALPTIDKDGDGEIEITTPEEFAAVAKSNGKDANGDRIKYELTGDIYLNDVKAENWQATANPWLDPVKGADVNANNTFCGIINGNGYVVHGVYVDKVYANGEIQRTEFADADYKPDTVITSGTELDIYEDVYAGLFPVIGRGAGLVALGMQDSYISVKDSSSPIVTKDGRTLPMNLIGSVGLVGTVANLGSNSAVIDQCFIDFTVATSSARVGLVGCGNKCGNNLSVTNCYGGASINIFTGTKGEGWDNNSGNRFMLVSGNESRPTMASCYTYGNITNNGVCNKTIGTGNNLYYYSGWAQSGYATSVDGNAIKGEGALTLMPNLDWDKFETVAGARPVLKIFKTHTLGTDGDIWDGSTDSEMNTNSKGEKVITNAAELRYAVTSTGNYVLGNNIWLNDVEVYARGGFFLADRPVNVWPSTGTFNGTFDGNGNIVYGLIYNTKGTLTDNASTYSGLIPNIASSTTVKNVGVENAYIRNHSNGRMGAVVGCADGSNIVIENCYAGANVYLEGFKKVGGITGGRDGNGNKTIRNCFSLASITVTEADSINNSYWGGIVGDSWANKYALYNCYTNLGVIVGQGGGTQGTNNYSTGGDTPSKGITKENMMGTDVLTNSSKMPNLNSDGAYVATAGYPILKVFSNNTGDSEEYVEEEEVGAVWNGSIAAKYAGGSGTKDDPYIIEKGSQLAKAINEFGQNGAYFKLTRDIYLNDVSKSDWNTNGATNYWFTGKESGGYVYNSYKGKVSEDTATGSTGTFYGNIDGNGFHVYGVCYPADSASFASALIPVLSGGNFTNLGLDHFYLKATDTAAAFAAFSASYKAPINIDKCYIGEDIKISSNDARGGFFGYANGGNSSNPITISNSYVLIPAANLGGYTLKACAFISETWNTTYYLKNCFSVTQPIEPAQKERASTVYQNDKSKMSVALSNVFCLNSTELAFGEYEKYDAGNGNVTYAFTALTEGDMRGIKVFSKMTINGDNAFIYNIGYPTLKVFGNSVPKEEELEAGLVKVGTISPDAQCRVDTKTFIISGKLTAGKQVAISLAKGANNGALVVAADGTATLSAGSDTVTKKIELGTEATYKMAVMGGFLIAFVNGECVGLVALESDLGYVATFSGFAAGDENKVDLFIDDITFDSVNFGNVDLQLADRFGNQNSSGVKLNATLADNDVIDDMGYEVEYGYLVAIGDTIKQNVTVNTANVHVFNQQTEALEIIGLGSAKQEYFFTLRGYAKIVVNDEIVHYYYSETETIFSPIYKANSMFENGKYAEELKKSYGASDKFIENYTGDIDLTLFADYHYEQGMYTSQLSDLQAIIDRALANDSDAIISLGDMSNDMVGSKEITNFLLNGTFSYKTGTVNNYHNIDFYNLYGNHELESNNEISYVGTVLTNSEVHWGDGSVGQHAATLDNKNATQKELETTTYYWYEKNGFRIIALDTNFSWNGNHVNGEVVGWEHNLKNSYGPPSAATNAGRGYDEGASATANTKTNNLGEVQLQWLEDVLLDAVEKGIPCVVTSHDSFSPNFGMSSAAPAVRDLYAKVNAIRSGTVIVSINGHLHTNRQAVLDDVLYLDINTVRNTYWKDGSAAHYNSSHTISIDDYYDDGRYKGSTVKSITSLSQASNTWFCADPLSCNVNITQRGSVTKEGIESSWMYDVVPTGLPAGKHPGTSSGSWTRGDESFTLTTQSAYILSK